LNLLVVFEYVAVARPQDPKVDMLVSFAEDAFGRDVRVVVVADILPLRLARRLVRLPHKIASAVAPAARG
jgi:hypothetical protein